MQRQQRNHVVINFVLGSISSSLTSTECSCFFDQPFDNRALKTRFVDRHLSHHRSVAKRLGLDASTIAMILTIIYRLWQVLWSLLPTSTTPAQMREMLPPDSYLHQKVFWMPSGLILIVEGCRFADEPLIPRRLRRVRGLHPITRRAVSQLPWSQCHVRLQTPPSGHLWHQPCGRNRERVEPRPFDAMASRTRTVVFMSSQAEYSQTAGPLSTPSLRQGLPRDPFPRTEHRAIRDWAILPSTSDDGVH
ncbi:hypothetical protein CCHR01_02205 [Colletotrichum chrysophilum]|uniref:Uncharacterized protein n=1 Tax=Colletotrichum chrysophilum TaxID=1836956 RepID=A0AAD9AV87_9PEZI|nr:hypothetical protein CCHR01_02205 [Colletotrichum chrysophilum]